MYLIHRIITDTYNSIIAISPIRRLPFIMRWVLHRLKNLISDGIRTNKGSIYAITRLSSFTINEHQWTTHIYYLIFRRIHLDKIKRTFAQYWKIFSKYLSS